MLLPIAGFLMVGVPVAGFVAGMVLCYFKELRYCAAFAFLVPVLASYSGCAGAIGIGLGVESLGFSDQVTGWSGLIGFLMGAFVGSWIGVKSGLWANRRIGIAMPWILNQFFEN
jgi:hypothetical protein